MMDGVQLSGVSELSASDRASLVRHVMDEKNWIPARTSAQSKANQDGRAKQLAVKTDTASTPARDSMPSSAVSSTSKREVFVPPKPGANGAKAGFLSGKRVMSWPITSHRPVVSFMREAHGSNHPVHCV